MGQMRDSDWSRENLLRSDWLPLIGASITTLFAHFSQVRTVPWYNGRLPFFVDGKITVSCSFCYSFSYMNLTKISIIFSVIVICIPLSLVTANMSSVQKDCQNFEC